MKRRELFLLFIAGLIFYSCVAWFERAPGYMDADYYYDGGLRLVQGQGFTETYLWNYLDNPQSLPHPSNGYWFPLASMIAAAGMFITGQQTFWAARLGFILIAAMVSPISALLCFQITQNRANSLAAGLLAIFSAYHAAYLPTTDNFGLFLLLGGLFFIILFRDGRFSALLLGIVAGLMNLSRLDGLIWCAAGVASLFFLWLKTSPRRKPIALLFSVIIFFAGYALIMGPWMIRNLSVWGTPFTPSGSNLLWLTRYDETFAWPASRINLQNWLQAGWGAFAESRLTAFKVNIFSTIGAQGGFLLFPFILAGLWVLRKDFRIKLAVFIWLVLFFIMSIVFPFAGTRGSFFHAGAALQTVWFAAAVVGLDDLISKARAQGRFTPAAHGVFRVSLVIFMAGLTVYLAYTAVIANGWNTFRETYARVEQMLVKNGAQVGDGVIVANPPGYFAATGRSAIAIPDENLDSVRALARQFGARYLVLEKTYYPDPMIPIYKNPESQAALTYLGEFDEVRVFKINP